MFSPREKREIANAVQKVLRATKNPELPDGEITFLLHVEGADFCFWADIRNNAGVSNTDETKQLKERIVI